MSIRQYSNAQKMLSDTRTDADRSTLKVDSAKFWNGYILDMVAMEREFLATATPEERKIFDSSTTWFDAMHPYFAKEGTMPLVFDLRRGVCAAAIGYVNCGANDYNNAEEKHGLCPSIMIAMRFDGKDVRDEEKPYLNDLLYVYRKLKEDSRGLNHEMIAAYEKKHPGRKITERLAEMDALLALPERERFASATTSKARAETKQGLAQQLSGVGTKRSFFGHVFGEKKSLKKG